MAKTMFAEPVDGATMTQVNSTLEDGSKASGVVTKPENEGELKRTHTFWTCTLSCDHERLVRVLTQWEQQ